MKNPPKLGEILAKTTFAFSQKKDTFTEAYPAIETLHVEVYENNGLSGEKWVATITQLNYRPAVACSNPLCYGGGAEVGKAISEMSYKREVNHETLLFCVGHEGTKTINRRRCDQTFTVKARITYKRSE